MAAAPAAQRESAGPRKLAVIGAAFFSYTRAVAAELAGRGIEVIEFDEKHSNRNSAKIIYRLGLGSNPFSPLPRYHEKLAGDIIAARIPDVLLLGVEVIGRAFVDRLVRSGVRVHLHMWDSQANQGRFKTYLDLLWSCSTFDPRDAEELGLPHIPLFAEPLFGRARGELSEQKYDIGFCGTTHSSRSALICRLVSAARAKRARIGLMLYYHSRALFAAKALVQWRSFKLLPWISGTPFPKSDVAKLFAGSRYVLDIPHPRQTGLTARTFEALLAGARVLTMNKDAVRLLPPSLAARVTLVERIEQVAELAVSEFIALPPLTEDEIYFLSLRRYVDQLLAQIGRQSTAEQGMAG